MLVGLRGRDFTGSRPDVRKLCYRGTEYRCSLMAIDFSAHEPVKNKGF